MTQNELLMFLFPCRFSVNIAPDVTEPGTNTPWFPSTFTLKLFQLQLPQLLQESCLGFPHPPGSCHNEFDSSSQPKDWSDVPCGLGDPAPNNGTRQR